MWRLISHVVILKLVSATDAAVSRMFASYQIPNIYQVVRSLQQPQNILTQWYEYQKKYHEIVTVKETVLSRVGPSEFHYIYVHSVVSFSHFILYRREFIPDDKFLHLTQCHAVFLRIL